MAGSNVPGPLGHGANTPVVDAGTMARTATPLPGPTGTLPSGPAAVGAGKVADTELSWDEVRADFERWEGKVSHMYLDTKGLVTVGIGKMLPDVTAAKALGFVRRSDGIAATAAEIETDFKEVSKQTKGKFASTYKQYTKLDLPDDAISQLLKDVVKGFESNLESNFAGYKTYPVAAKRALIDMIYNLGLKGLLTFKIFKAAVEARDWKKASQNCHRVGPSDERNNWTRDMFLEAAK